MHLALTGLFRARWSADIHEEWISALLRNRPDLTRAKLERTRMLMDEHATDALVTDYQHLIPGLQLPDPNDRHVLAAAIRARADVIVTINLRDFPAETLAAFGIEAQHPDEFVLHLLDLSPGVVVGAAQDHRLSLKNSCKNGGKFALAGWRYSSIEGGQQHVLSDAGCLAALERMAVDSFNHLEILGDVPQGGDGAKLALFSVERTTWGLG